MLLKTDGTGVIVGADVGGGPTRNENESSEWNSPDLRSMMADSSAESSPARIVTDPSP